MNQSKATRGPLLGSVLCTDLISTWTKKPVVGWFSVWVKPHGENGDLEWQ